MNRRRWISISGLAGFVLLLAIWWWQSGPHYRGKSLNWWLRGFESDVPGARWQSADAVRHIGTKALPLLLAQLRQPPHKREPEPEWKQKFRDLLSMQSIVKINVPRPADERMEALAALDALGPVAKDAVPALEALLHEKPHADVRAILVLGEIGTDAKPALTRALTNENKLIRPCARVCLDMLQTNSEVLFPKTAADAEFIRKQSRFNVSVLNAAHQEYRAQHPDAYLPYSVDGKPPPSRLPPGFTPIDINRTNLPRILTVHAGEGVPGVRIFGLKELTNSTLSGTVSVSFEAHNDVGMLRYAMLQVDGHIFPGDGGMLDASIFSPPLKNPLRFEMDTCFLENGRHTLRIETGWNNLSPTNFDDTVFPRASSMISITVSNEIYYPEWEPEMGEKVSAYFFKTTRTNADWHLDIYDVKKKFVKRLSGHTTDGKIEAFWDLKDSKGVLRNNADIDPEFSSVVTIDDPSGKGKVLRKYEPGESTAGAIGASNTPGR